MSDKVKITAKQQKTLDAIRAYKKANGYAPRYKDLAEMLGVTQTVAWASVRKLANKGIVTQSYCARAIKIVGE